MRLISLSLRNFKGIKSFTLDIGGEDVNVFGDNATGKTTVQDAFYWLLFDKDSANRKDFDIKTLDQKGNVIHGLEHEVEGVFDVGGMDLALRKVYTEKWTKKRGSATKEFTGHTVDHFIDGVPVKKGEYESRIKELVNEDAFKLLTNPKYFNEHLRWQERRQILLEVCGDISDAEVIASDKDLSELPGILGKRSLDEHRKVIAAQRTEINRELDRIPVRIDEVRRGLPDIAGLDELQLMAEAAELKKAVHGKEQQISRIEEGGEVAEKVKIVREIEAELFKIQSDCQEGQGRKIQEAQKLVYEAKSKRSEINLTTENIERTLVYSRKVADELEPKIESKRTEWHEVNSEEFSFEQDEVCPTCGQVLPAERLQEAREKALASFNRNKASALETISREGKKLKAQKDELEKEIREKQAALEQAQKALGAAEKEIEAATAALERVMAGLEEYAEDPAYRKKLKEKDAIEAAIRKLKEGSRQEVDTVRKEIAALQELIRETEGRLMNIARSMQGEGRIEELEAQERRLAAEYERLEEELYLTEQFIRSKVQLLEKRINSRFQHARFKLFNVLINGGVEECCETLYQGVPYNSALNNAARINVGLDIINTLSEHYGFQAPIWIDNREAVTKLIPIRAQVISLVVSEPDKKLRVEHVETKIKEVV